MRAVRCHQPGRLQDLIVDDMPSPNVGKGQVLLDVEAAGVNYVDALFVEGRYQIKPTPPFTPGSEVAGTIAALGSEVDGLAVGDRVLVSCGLGGFSQQLLTPAASVVKIPEVLTAPAAACFTQSYSTALYALRTRVHVEAGERVLVLGAGGGVGLAAIEVAKHLGATVIGAASTEPKRSAALRSGADVVTPLDPSTLKDAVREAMDGGVDVVIDPIGGASTVAALRTLRDFGRLAVIGFASGPIADIPANQVLLRNRSIVGVDWGIWAMTHGDEQRRLLNELLHLVEEGVLHPTEPTMYRLDEAALALSDLLKRKGLGKVALDCS